MKALAASLPILLGACSAPVAEQAPPAAPAVAVAAQASPAGDPVEGRRIATRVGCLGCHDKQLQGAPLWAEKGKYEVYSANITEKRALYDDAAFERLLRTGKTHDGHRPFGMPISMFQHLSDREVRDLTAFVRSLPTVANPGLKTTWMDAATRKEQEAAGDDRGDPVAAGAPAEPPTESSALGKYLVMTTCTECHGVDLKGGGDVPPLIVAKGYSLEQFRTLMRTGITAQGKESKSGLMTTEARERLAPSLSDADIVAIKTYLDSP